MIKQYTLTQKLLIGIPCGLAALALIYFGIWVISENLQIAFEEIANQMDADSLLPRPFDGENK